MVSVAEQEFLYKELTYAIIGAVPAAGKGRLALRLRSGQVLFPGPEARQSREALSGFLVGTRLTAPNRPFTIRNSKLKMIGLRVFAAQGWEA